jgi:hypothetical protein
VRRMVAAAAMVGVLALAGGCGAKAAAQPGPQWPAAAAGRLCPLLDFDTVANDLGVRFDTAGGGRQDDTLTCAVTQAGHDFPYLTVAATGSDADELIFVATVIPSNGQTVPGLGRVAYQLALPAAAGGGPGLEVCWLSGSKRLVVLRYFFPAGATDADVAALLPKLVALAHTADTTLSKTTDLTAA